MKDFLTIVGFFMLPILVYWSAGCHLMKGEDLKTTLVFSVISSFSAWLILCYFWEA
jgi:hypothetical protein